MIKIYKIVTTPKEKKSQSVACYVIGINDQDVAFQQRHDEGEELSCSYPKSVISRKENFYM